MHPGRSELQIDAGLPARLTAAAIPLVAVVLVASAAARGAMTTGPDSPVSPWIVAVLTLAGAVLLSWRASRQVAVLDDDGLWCRNLGSTLRLDWSMVQELRQVRRPGVVAVELHLVGSRRRVRLGAATRPAGAAADEVAAALAAHPRAGALWVPDDPWS